jgi:hypothetical protein
MQTARGVEDKLRYEGVAEEIRTLYTPKPRLLPPVLVFHNAMVPSSPSQVVVQSCALVTVIPISPEALLHLRSPNRATCKLEVSSARSRSR